MNRSTTIRVDFEKLAQCGPSAAIVIKLMIACNDMSLADQSLAAWQDEPAPSQKGRQIGAQMYFVRLMLAHLNEAMKVIDAIHNDPALSAIVQQCDAATQASFKKLMELRPQGARHKEYQKLIGRLRNNVTFHYDEDGKLLNRALTTLASRTTDRSSSITRGSTAHLWHFKIADNIVNHVVCHQIWEIPPSSNVLVEADIKIARCHEIFLWFVDFAGEFIWKYCSE